MGRLFWKFFAAFWLGLAVVAGVVVAGIWLSRWFDLIPAPRWKIDRVVFLMDTARALVKNGDVAALRSLDKAAKREAYELPYLIDPEGHDLLERPIAANLWVQVQKAPEQHDALQARRGLGLLERVAMPDGVVITMFESAAILRQVLVVSSSEPPPFWLPMTATVLISTLFGGLLAWYVSQPVRTLRWALRQLADGQLETRVQALMGKRRDELSELGADFDRMALRVQMLVASQQRLLHDVSHELRSPLARIQAAIGVARQQPDRLLAMQERVERESMRLDALVEELLTLSRLETTAKAANQDRIDVMDLLADICEDARFEAQTAHRELIFSARGHYAVVARADLLSRAFENIVRNAVKFTREGTAVTVTAEASETALTVTVSDHGPGVPPDAQAMMFEPFQRLGSTSVDGFGLGLTIAKRAIESHGGRIEAESAPSGGLTIRVDLPRSDE